MEEVILNDCAAICVTCDKEIGRGIEASNNDVHGASPLGEVHLSTFPEHVIKYEHDLPPEIADDGLGGVGYMPFTDRSQNATKPPETIRLRRRRS